MGDFLPPPYPFPDAWVEVAENDGELDGLVWLRPDPSYFETPFPDELLDEVSESSQEEYELVLDDECAAKFSTNKYVMRVLGSADYDSDAEARARLEENAVELRIAELLRAHPTARRDDAREVAAQETRLSKWFDLKARNASTWCDYERV